MMYFRETFNQYWIPIMDVCDDLGMKYTTVRKYLNELANEGILEKKEQQNEENNGRTVYYAYTINTGKIKKEKTTA